MTEAARVLGVTRAALSALLNGRASLSPDMALRVDTLMRMQASYDIAEARDRAGEIKVKRYVVKSRRAQAALSQV